MKAHSLLIQRPDAPPENFALEKELVRIGRANDNDIVLVDDARSVSRWHATVQYASGGTATLTDLNSANGTSVNGKRIAEPVELRANDLVTIGNFQITLREESAPDLPYDVQPGAVELDRLQDHSRLLDMAGAKDFATFSQLRHLELLHDIGMTMAKSQTVKEVMKSAVALLFRIGEVHRATLLLWDETRHCFEQNDLYLRGGGTVAAATAPFAPDKLVMSRAILDRVRQENRPLLIRDVRSDPKLTASSSIARAGIQTALCSPLTYHGKLLGVLYADNLVRPDAFPDSDFRTFTTIAAQAGLALAHAQSAQDTLRKEAEREALKLCLPPQVAEMLLAADGSVKLGGESRVVTVLFADIRGFTALANQMDARETVMMLNEYFTAMSAVIFEHRGTLDKFIGDGMMALFGAPVQSANNAEQAVEAARHMQRETSRINGVRAAKQLPDIRLGIGIHTGPAVVGNIGSADRVQYTAVGETVKIAARLVNQATGGQILASQDVTAAFPNCGDCEDFGEVEFEGHSSSTKLYSLRWA